MMTALAAGWSFLKGFKLETILFLVVAAVAALAVTYSIILSHRIDAAKVELALAQKDARIAEQQLKDAQGEFEKSLSAIKTLEQNLKTNRIDIAPLESRVDDLNRKDANAEAGPFVDRLNALNADLNRMLERTGR